MRRALTGSLLALLAQVAVAHPLAPALLELREVAPAQYQVQWRTSLTRAQGTDVSPQLPQDCRPSAATATPDADRDALTLRWTLDCTPQGLAGREIAVSGLERGRINVIVSLVPLAAPPQQMLLDAAQPGWRLPGPGAVATRHAQVQATLSLFRQRLPPVFGRYLGLGVQHLLLGMDHVLFVAGLVLLLRRLCTLLLTVTAFTLGHSLTLALATLGWVHVDARLTETGIALSLLLLAVEAARPEAQRRLSWLARWPGSVACAFGLLHGLGFAGALSALGLPPAGIPLALLAFNLGIEAGQLLVIAGLLAGLALWRLRPAEWVTRAGAMQGTLVYGLGTAAAYWCFERGSQLL